MVARRWLLTRGAAVTALTLLAVSGGALAEDSEKFKPDEYRLLPVRIHVLRAEKAPDLDARLKERDIHRILGKINGIWKQAAIQFFPESILEETADSQELYQGLGDNRTLAHLRIIRPRETRSERMFHLYYIRNMGPNGICFDGSHQLLFIKDTAALNPVPGGIDEPLPRVSAHEMGHALGLPHRQDRTNLMASGTTGTSLNEAEITKSREAAGKMDFHLTPSQALDRAAELKGKPATDLLTVLSQLPGAPGMQARQRLAEGS